MFHTKRMNLSDNLAAIHPEAWRPDVLSVWSLVAVQSVADAADQALPEHARSLRILIDHLVADTDSESWRSLVHSIHTALAEATANPVYIHLHDELWQVLTGEQYHRDLMSVMWTQRHRVEVSLGAVVAAIAKARPARARRSMERHIGVLAGLLTDYC
ncbi:FCD domain-containing protein [Mycolicibacterium sphagni]|uniref:FCD domain-containing protein n=1 Tax=Mycolicibacterium sphagni TaxID=1786 RepID=A0ABX2K753_9MYCO|nr:FCD domain-containing protein [Mycolicibacterium sphagni]NTY63530.1 FCD domain-containing protein [Mycolicibacterium sphagni]